MLTSQRHIGTSGQGGLGLLVKGSSLVDCSVWLLWGFAVLCLLGPVSPFLQNIFTVLRTFHLSLFPPSASLQERDESRLSIATLRLALHRRQPSCAATPQWVLACGQSGHDAPLVRRATMRTFDFVNLCTALTLTCQSV